MHPTPSSTKPLIFQYFHHSIPQPRYIFAAIVDGITQPDVAPFAFTKIPNGSFNIKLVPKPFFRFVTFCIFPKVETNEPNTQMSASATQTAGKATAAACDVRRAEEHVTRKTTHTSTRTLLHTLPCSHRSDASAWGARVVNDFQIWREHHHCLRGNQRICVHQRSRILVLGLPHKPQLRCGSNHFTVAVLCAGQPVGRPPGMQVVDRSRHCQDSRKVSCPREQRLFCQPVWPIPRRNWVVRRREQLVCPSVKQGCSGRGKPPFVQVGKKEVATHVNYVQVLHRPHRMRTVDSHFFASVFPAQRRQPFGRQEYGRLRGNVVNESVPSIPGIVRTVPKKVTRNRTGNGFRNCHGNRQTDDKQMNTKSTALSNVLWATDVLAKAVYTPEFKFAVLRHLLQLCLHGIANIIFSCGKEGRLDLYQGSPCLFAVLPQHVDAGFVRQIKVHHNIPRLNIFRPPPGYRDRRNRRILNQTDGGRNCAARCCC